MGTVNTTRVCGDRRNSDPEQYKLRPGCTGYADKCPVPCREIFWVSGLYPVPCQENFLVSGLCSCFIDNKTEARAKRGVPSALTMNIFSAGPGGRGMPVIMNF